MRHSIRTLAWLRDLVIVLLAIAGIDLWRTTPRLSLLLILSAVVVFVERALWTWYLLDLRDAERSSVNASS